MRKLHLLFMAALILLCTSCGKTDKSMKSIVNGAFKNAMEQSLQMAGKYTGQQDVFPRYFVNGKMITAKKSWWCSGFFPGVLWMLYEHSNDTAFLRYAREYTERLESIQYEKGTHDVGFLLFCSYGNGYRITKDPSYRSVLMNGAISLSTRYRDNIGMIRSWDFNKDRWQFPVIIDNMMNLELLTWASKESGDRRLMDIAVSHSDKTIEHHYRPDFSCYHVVSFDTITGMPHAKQTHQGYNDESVWSRGQAWGLYGFTYMYRETGNKKYLDQAINIANYLIDNPVMPSDFIPYWDLKAPNIPNELRDASAAAIMASALIELSGYADKQQADKFIRIAETQIRTLASAEYTAPAGENGNFILMHSVGSLPGKSEVDVPLTYADYYYVEALMRYKKLKGF